jgi:hypothetical protein
MDPNPSLNIKRMKTKNDIAYFQFNLNSIMKIDDEVWNGK